MFVCSAEIRRLKRDTEDAMNKNLESLRQQVADDKRLQEQMGGDMANLENKLRKFAAQNKELQGQVRPSDERLKIIVYTTGGISAEVCFWGHIG